MYCFQLLCLFLSFFFFFNDTATTEIYTFSLHDALPILNEMSSTARTTAVARAKSPRRTGKCLVRFFASRTGPAMLAGKPAAAGMSVGHAELGRCLRAAPVHDFRAARVERAAARERGGVWRLAVDRGEPRAAVAEARDGLEERPGVRMRRRVVDPRHGAV